MELKKLDGLQIENIVSKAINDATDFIDSEIEPQRIKAQRYFDGEVDIGHEEGRSKVVATKCREAVRGIKPSIQRVFLTNDKPVEFVPRGPEDVATAEQATSYISYKFAQHDGYRVLSDVFQDALVKKAGIAYVYYDTETRQEIETHVGINDDVFSFLAAQENAEIIEHTETQELFEDETGNQVMQTKHDVKIGTSYEQGDITIQSLPPEDFFVDRNARSLDDFYVVGHTSEMTVADLLAMGFSLDDIKDIDYGNYSVTDDEAEFERRNFAVDESEDENITAASKKISVTNAFMKLDVEGTGVPKLYQFICAGSEFKVLDFYEADEVPYAIFECDPEPHAFFGSSLVDLVINDQDAATSMLRGVLDNVALTNNPGVQVMEGQAKIEDLLNNEIGRIVRVSNPNAITEMAIPFTAGSTLPALQYFDQLVDNKTGVSKMAQGLDPNVLKSTTATAIAASQNGQTGQAEVIARNFAEGGMKQMFSLMLRLMVKNGNEVEMMRLNGSFVPVNPKGWEAEMDLIVNVGIGNGRENERMSVLQQALSIQQQIYTAYGAQNGIVTLTQIRNTLADILAIGGVRNADRYFMPMTPEVENMMIRNAQANQQRLASQQQDPNQAYLAAEQMKSNNDLAKAKMQNDYKMHELGMKDDLERDKMVQDIAVKFAEMIGKYDTAIDIEAIKAEQNRPREHNEAMKTAGLNGQGY